MSPIVMKSKKKSCCRKVDDSQPHNLDPRRYFAICVRVGHSSEYLTKLTDRVGETNA